MKKLRKYNIIGLIAFLIVIFMSVGFALYHQELGLNGNVTLKKQGKLEIVSANIVSNESTNLEEYTEPTIDGMNISFKLKGSSQNFTATYLIEIKNNSYLEYTFNDFPFNASIDTSDGVTLTTLITDSSTGEELQPGSIIASGESKIYKVLFTVETQDSSVEVSINGTGTFSTDNTGNIIASVTPKTGDLQNNKTACFTLSVANTYAYNRVFNITSSNDNILLVDNSGNTYGTQSVGANSTEEYVFCTKASESSSFLSDETTTVITLSSAGISNINVGELTLSVDKDIITDDKEIPTIGNVTIAIPEESTVVGQANVSWNRIDSGGSSITNYYIILYNADTGTSNTYETGSSVTSYTLSNLSAGNYYVKVYGVDEAGNIGSSYCDSATTSNGYCSLSNTTALKWQYTVTYSLTNLNHDNSSSTTSTATIYQSFTTTLAVNSSSTWYSLPSSVNITMNGTTLTSGTDYTYNSSSGTITINKITGDVTITASAAGGCLTKGTKITLVNGKTKNIEDINYNDLLLVWNYETGAYTYEYPIWIEKVKKSSNYKKITLSDGTVLKTVGKHGVFSENLNRFVSVDDNANFKVGIEIAKLNNDNNISYVKVINIEDINEEIEYYHVVSTRYYNIIANGILTTDGNVILSNLYDFEDNIKWKNRNYNTLNLYDYSLFEDVMPYYMFKGMRVSEGSVLSNYLSYPIFKKYLINNQLNDEMLLKPTEDYHGNRLWMVTTSDSNIINKNDYLYKENDYYILKEPKNKINFKYWYNTSDGKVYNSGDKVRVDYSMHFLAIYE